MNVQGDAMAEEQYVNRDQHGGMIKVVFFS
jgi:hypothetical protein